LSDKRIKCKFCSKDFNDKTGIDSLRYHQKSYQSIRDSLKRKIISKFNFLKENLNHVNSKVSFTCDIWISISGHLYLAITVHFINEKFEMKNFLLDFDLIPFPHDGQQICNKIEEILFEFNFETKFIALTTDNAKNNVKGIRLY
jgi:hypothetical protein